MRKHDYSTTYMSLLLIINQLLHSHIFTQVISMFSVFFICVSILSFCLKTHPDMRVPVIRNITIPGEYKFWNNLIYLALYKRYMVLIEWSEGILFWLCMSIVYNTHFVSTAWTVTYYIFFFPFSREDHYLQYLSWANVVKMTLSKASDQKLIRIQSALLSRLWSVKVRRATAVIFSPAHMVCTSKCSLFMDQRLIFQGGEHKEHPDK
jgi:hypothetical protein